MIQERKNYKKMYGNGDPQMKLTPVQFTILAVQTVAIAFNLYAVLVKRAADSQNHLLAAALVLIMMLLSIKSWIDAKAPAAGK